MKHQTHRENHKIKSRKIKKNRKMEVAVVHLEAVEKKLNLSEEVLTVLKEA